MQKTGTGSEAFAPVEQSGEYADQLRENLQDINLPEGKDVLGFERAIPTAGINVGA